MIHLRYVFVKLCMILDSLANQEHFFFFFLGRRKNATIEISNEDTNRDYDSGKKETEILNKFLPLENYFLSR